MYYIVTAIFFLFSLLPWWFLFAISDVCAFFLYYIIRYRKQTVFKNLQIAFPEKSKEEHKKIARLFYKNFTDSFLETIKLRFISRKEFSKRFSYNHDVLQQAAATGKNMTIGLCHMFNWEFTCLGISLNFPFSFIAVYMPIKNKALDRLFFKLRSRFGAKMVRATKFKEDFLHYEKQIFAIGLVADQRPGSPYNAYWVPFFGKLTPFVKGPEKNAVMHNAYMVYCEMKKIKRGYYNCNLEIITKTPAALPKGEITRTLVAKMEKTIREQPANYLWSHKRWKWNYEEEKFGSLRV